jgi:hypothetical protein
MNLKEWLTKTFRKHKHKHDLLMDILMENNTNYLIFQCKCGNIKIDRVHRESEVYKKHIVRFDENGEGRQT